VGGAQVMSAAAVLGAALVLRLIIHALEHALGSRRRAQ
jgi:hypothetical protein